MSFEILSNTLRECNGFIDSVLDQLFSFSRLLLDLLLLVILFALLGVTQMFLNRLGLLVLFAGPEGLVCTPSGFNFSPQPIEQRWIQGKCKAKGGDPFDCGQNRLVQVQDYNIIFLHSFRVSLMHKREFLSCFFSFLHKRLGMVLWCFFFLLFLLFIFFIKISNRIPYSQTWRCSTSLGVSLIVIFFSAVSYL